MAKYAGGKKRASGKRASSKKKRVERTQKRVVHKLSPERKKAERKKAERVEKKPSRAAGAEARAEKKRRSEAAIRGHETRKKRERAEARAEKKRKAKAKVTRDRRAAKATPSKKRKTKRQLETAIKNLEKKLETLLDDKKKKRHPKKVFANKKKDLEAAREKVHAEAVIAKATPPSKAHVTPEELLRIREEAKERLEQEFRGIIDDAAQRGEIPTPPLGEIEERDGAKTLSSRIHVPIGIELDASEIPDIVETVRRAARSLEPRSGWYATVALSGFGRRIVGSGGWKPLKSDDLAERGIQAEAYSSTGAHGSLDAMLSRLWEVLEKLAAENATILVRYVTVTTFDRKTWMQQQEWKQEHEQQ